MVPIESSFTRKVPLLLNKTWFNIQKVRNDSCTVHKDFADDIKECYAGFDPNLEERSPFGPDSSDGKKNRQLEEY